MAGIFKSVAIQNPATRSTRRKLETMNHKDIKAPRNALLFLTLMLGWTTHAMATFSIVAIDPATGDLGVAVASRYFAVGAVVPWAEANVGAIATQANVNAGYGARGLELLRQGLTAPQGMDKLFAEDTVPGKGGRQIAIVDSK